ncbi:Hypothetical_protein [Hexamita inflata]|uniref:Hypothetical_protein n=1 Tax=Hexamita inflata TaxID=28002 RepID=A0AA86QVA8_9EUKA|nr:Hypothetical protein HINF_LOCUS52910 [Hexamita inflata]
MSSIINEKHLMSAIKRLLALTNSDISYVIYQVMVLPDVTYNLLFCQLSFDLNVKLETIRSLFSALSTNYLYINQFQSTSKSFYTLPQTESQTKSQNSSPIMIDKSQSQYDNVKVTERLNKLQKIKHSDQIHDNKKVLQRRKTKQSITESQSQSQNNSLVIQRQKITKQSDKIQLSQFKQQFSETVKTIIMEFDDSANEMTDKQICQVLIDYFQKNDQSVFWERVQSIITYKTKVQLKEYFQKSFKQCQYENISEQDKQKIVALIQAMPQSKPSEIVDVFFNQIGGEVYFRRKVIMFVYYLKRIVK